MQWFQITSLIVVTKMNPNEILNESGQETQRIAYFPVSFFSVIMGLSGFTLAWKGADNLFFHNSEIWLLFAYMVIREFR